MESKTLVDSTMVVVEFYGYPVLRRSSRRAGNSSSQDEAKQLKLTADACLAGL